MTDLFTERVRETMTRLSDEHLDEIATMTPGGYRKELIRTAALDEIQERASLVYY